MPRFLPVAVVALVALVFTATAQAETPCTRYAAPAGSDSADGSLAAPYRSVQRLADELEAGEVGCLRAGTYEGSVKVTEAGITLRGLADERAIVVGRLWIARGANGVTVERLYLDGRNASNLPSPTINADDVTFRRNDVTNGHTAICFVLGSAEYGRAGGTLIEANRIHHCGALPAANHDHGIYIEQAKDTVIRGNWIYENADRGIQLYPNAQDTTITGNVIDGNGQGVIFGGEEQESSDSTRVEGNVITNSKLRHNVESFYGGDTPPGENNFVTRNCIGGGARDKGNGGIQTPTVGFDVAANRTSVDPGYVNRGSDYRLAAASPCRALYAYADAVPGPDGIPAPRAAAIRRAPRTGPALVLKADRRKASRLGRVGLHGWLRRAAKPGAKVRILVRTRRGHWRPLAKTRVRENGHFRVRPRLKVGRGRAAVRLIARVDDLGRSRSVRLRMRPSR